MNGNIKVEVQIQSSHERQLKQWDWLRGPRAEFQ